MDVREQRVKFVVAAERREQTLTALCREFGISRSVGYEWLKRYREAGVAGGAAGRRGPRQKARRAGAAVGGIAERSRRPQQSPRRTATAVEQRVVELRERYPDWGARKLRVLLQREGVELARNTVHRILLRRGLVREEDQHSPATERFERGGPMWLGQRNFKG